MDGCSIALRRVEGPEARELYLHCQPSEAAEAGRQAEAGYRAILGVLEAEGGGAGSLVCETLFLRDLRGDLGAVRAARGRALDSCEGDSERAASSEIQQPPLDPRARLEISVQALIPKRAPLRAETVPAASGCGCGECALSRGLRIELGGEARLYAGNLQGAGQGAYEQATAMFGVAEELLRQAGMEFGDVVRTWIHLRDIGRDYDELNRARRVFFEARGIDPPPASTGIGGAPVAAPHDLSLGLYAASAGHAPERVAMTAPTLNEAPRYGADFVRGLRVADANKVALHVSGTASIDEAGRTAHAGEFEAQVDRMLLNVAGLLGGQGAGFGDVVSAVTYLKRPQDAARLREKLRDAGFHGFPNALVEAPICRPELLCETEVLAIVPGPAPEGA